MKKLLIILLSLILVTGCTNENGNSISKLETTIYKTNNHTEIEIENAFDFIKHEFMDETTFYHASLLTIEYGKNDTLEKENKMKNDLQANNVIYLDFTFKTGDVEYRAMQSNYVYHYETYLIKYNENDDWHIYNMNIYVE